MLELWQIYLSLSEAPPWLNPNQGPQPLSLFWQAQFIVLSIVGMVIFMLWISNKIMPEAMDWVHSIRPFLKRSWKDYEDWKKR